MLTGALSALILLTGCTSAAPTPLGDHALFLIPEDTQGVGDPDLEMITATPHALWITGERSDATTVRSVTQRAAEAERIVQIAIYAIPGRDCGNHSSGGLSPGAYGPWIDEIAASIDGSPIIVLEPDALVQNGVCAGQGDRHGMLADAATALAAAGAQVYIDAGNSAWLSSTDAATRLNALGSTGARGFAVNVSNYRTTSESTAWAEEVSRLTGGQHYVIDTSRNGNGPNGEWCNARGRALGELPRLVDDGTALDALLWIKVPGESDGLCGGGPPAGEWWPEIADELVANARTSAPPKRQ